MQSLAAQIEEPSELVGQSQELVQGAAAITDEFASVIADSLEMNARRLETAKEMKSVMAGTSRHNILFFRDFCNFYTISIPNFLTDRKSHLLLIGYTKDGDRFLFDMAIFSEKAREPCLDDSVQAIEEHMVEIQAGYEADAATQEARLVAMTETAAELGGNGFGEVLQGGTSIDHNIFILRDFCNFNTICCTKIT